jgi:XTP/dITP diphosphohydrolase
MERTLNKYKEFSDVLDKLRIECPWDREQTWETLRTMTIEEVYELADAIADNDVPNVKKELGDVFLHIAFYAKIAQEQGLFDMADVLQSLSEKLIYRHPHIFGDVKADDAEAVSRNWEKLKLKEKDGNKSVLSGVPKALPALIKAYRIQGKAKSVGFDWNTVDGVWQKISEELDEFKREVGVDNRDAMEDEMGDILFSVVNLCRFYKINPEDALERTNRKFIRRFSYVESRTLANGRDIKDMTLAELDAIWDEYKQIEKEGNNDVLYR